MRIYKISTHILTSRDFAQKKHRGDWCRKKTYRNWPEAILFRRCAATGAVPRCKWKGRPELSNLGICQVTYEIPYLGGMNIHLL